MMSEGGGGGTEGGVGGRGADGLGTRIFGLEGVVETEDTGSECFFKALTTKVDPEADFDEVATSEGPTPTKLGFAPFARIFKQLPFDDWLAQTAELWERENICA